MPNRTCIRCGAIFTAPNGSRAVAALLRPGLREHTQASAEPAHLHHRRLHEGS